MTQERAHLHGAYVQAFDPKKVSGQAVGPCPVCGGDDRFWIRENGSFGCRGCEPGRQNPEAAKRIIEALDNLAGIEPRSRPGSQIVRTHVYDSKPPVRHVKMSDGQFPWQHHDGYDWKRTMGGVKMKTLLWGRERLLDGVTTVVILEGEKDADAAHAHNTRKDVAYVSGPGGADNDALDWTALRALPNLEKVYIFFDADAAGRKGVQKYGRRAVTELPGVEVLVYADEGDTGRDLSDAVEDGTLRKWLLKHLKNARPPEPVKETRGFTTVPEALQEAKTGESTQGAAGVEFARTHKDRFLYVGGTWYIYSNDSGLWEADEKDTVLEAVREAFPGRGINWYNAVLRHSRSGEDVLIRKVKDVDANNDLVACGNGQVMRIEGKRVHVEPARADMLLTKKLGAPPDADADKLAKWEGYVLDWTGDQDTARCLQILTGLSLFGRVVKLKSVTFLEGTKNTGKTTFTDCLLEAFGDYGRSCADVFDYYNRRDRELKLGELPGIRLALIPDFDGKLNAQIVKPVSGGDVEKGRVLHGQPFTFSPQCWIIGCSNELPAPSKTDAALKDRLKVIPFERQFKEGTADRVEDLKSVVKATMLGTMIEWGRLGMELYLRKGFAWPVRVRARTDEFYQRIDPFEGWLAECCIQSWDAMATGAELFESYNSYRDSQGLDPVTKRTLFDRLNKRGYKDRAVRIPGQIKTGRRRVGIGLVTEVTSSLLPQQGPNGKKNEENRAIAPCRANTEGVTNVTNAETWRCGECLESYRFSEIAPVEVAGSYRCPDCK